MTRRLEHWIRDNNLLNKGQKGGSKYEGCIEHNAILNAAFEHSKYTRHLSISVAWLDIANAFPSVPHKYLWGLLRFIGVNDSFVDTLELFYTDISSFYVCGPITTPDLPIRRGVKQGCPISMTLFALAINPVLEAIEILSVPNFSIGISSVKVLAYADDIALIANDTSDLQKLIDKAVEVTEWAGLQYRPDKCAFISLPHINTDDVISINNVNIKRLLAKEFYMYLGVPVGDKNDQSPYEILDKLVIDLGKIVNSDLWDWQKLKSYRIFMHSRLVYAFRNREIKISVLEEKNSKIKAYMKQLLHLPNQAEICYLYSSIVNGGVGLTGLIDEYHTQCIVQAFRLLNSDCPLTKRIISDSLCFVSSTRLRIANPSIGESLEWINGKKSMENSASKKTRKEN